jgi:hypothetical protein
MEAWWPQRAGHLHTFHRARAPERARRRSSMSLLWSMHPEAEADAADARCTARAWPILRGPSLAAGRARKATDAMPGDESIGLCAPYPPLSCPASVRPGVRQGLFHPKTRTFGQRTLARHRGDWRVDLEAGSAKHSIRSKLSGKCHCLSTGSVLSERDHAHPNCEVASESRAVPSRSHSSSFDQRRRPETFLTAIATAFICPTRTTKRLPRRYRGDFAAASRSAG